MVCLVNSVSANELIYDPVAYVTNIVEYNHTYYDKDLNLSVYREDLNETFGITIENGLSNRVTHELRDFLKFRGNDNNASIIPYNVGTWNDQYHFGYAILLGVDEWGDKIYEPHCQPLNMTFNFVKNVYN
ncbi:MAG: hypothetical protein LBV42_04375 [Methanobrevibacter sp.]|jgi:hypothetical protein|nr:hypothetical protein [Methanobrevibacter sp.]